MRRFVVVSYTAPPDGDFELNDLAGSAGRVDILCRCVTSALLLSHGIRRDVVVNLVVLTERERPRTITIRGDRVRHLNPDERSTASLLRSALRRPPGGESTPGIRVDAVGLEAVVPTRPEGGIYLLDENGIDAHECLSPEGDMTFLLGSRDDIAPVDVDALPSTVRRISVSPHSLHADHCITILHGILDRIGSRGTHALPG